MKKRILALACVLALVVALVVPMAALAEDTEVTGYNEGTSVSITVPDPMDFGTFSIQTYNAVRSIGVDTNCTWIVEVEDAYGDGYMLETVYEIDQLTNSMNILTLDAENNGMGSDVQVDLANGSAQIAAGDDADSSFGVHFLQEIVNADLFKETGTYGIVVTFTITAVEPE